MITTENYLKKYNNKYKVKREKDWCYEIICKEGSIYLYSISKQLLSFYVNCQKNPKRRLSFAKSLKKIGIWHEVLLEGDFEVIICFKEEDLVKLEKVLKIKKNRSTK